MRALQLILYFFHGLIHLMGFSKAFGLATINQLSVVISKVHGIFWFISAALFMAAAVAFLLHEEWWWMLATGGVLISQYLIIVSWRDAKFGTIGNGLILVTIILGFAAWNFYRQYNKEVRESLALNSIVDSEILTEAEIQNLPLPVQHYLNYTGAVGKSKVTNFRAEFIGQLRQQEETNWMEVSSQQYNFMQAPARLFYLKATMKHLPVRGFHCYKNGKAFMNIKVFSLFPVQYQTGEKMDVAETVTFFNDMCVLAPATLIDSRITWISTDKNLVRAKFTNNGITISASLYFNDNGELVNFISNDRYAALESGAMEKTPWSTPLGTYQDFNGHKLPTSAEAIYKFPKGDFCYGKFTLTNVEYNVLETD